MSARELKAEIERVNDGIMQAYQEKQAALRNYLQDALPVETKQQIEEFLKEEE